MRTHRMVLLVLGFSLVASVAAAASKPDGTKAAEIAAIQQVRESLDAAYDRRDAGAFSGLFLADADFQWPDGSLLRDREEIRQYFAKSFAVMPADYRHITTFTRIRFLGPDVAIGDGTVVIARAGAAESETPYMKVLLTCIGKKEQGRWLIAAARLIPILPQ
jgi:uncharacterized protein (TIGR02246 family)